MSDLRFIQTIDAPEAIGPYSQAVVCEGWVFCSGQIPLVPGHMTLIEGDIAEQTGQVLQNLSAVLVASGASLSTVVKTTIFLADMDDFAAVNTVYAGYFGDHRPARATVQAAGLPKGVGVEIECIARIP